MAFIIDTINGSGLYAQSAASASVATYDSNGNVITATYLSSHQPISADEWNETYETVSTNSGSWGGSFDPSDLSAYVPYSAYDVAIGDSNYANQISLAQGEWTSADIFSLSQGNDNSARVDSLAQGEWNIAVDDSLAQGQSNSANGQSLAQGYSNSAYANSLAQGSWNLAWGTSLAQGASNSATIYSQAFGKGNIITNSGMAIGVYNKTSAGVSFVIGNGDENNRSDSFIIYHDGSVSAMGKISAAGVELGAGGGEFPISADEAIQYVENNSATINDVNTTYQTNSATYLTAHQPISADEWNDVYDTVNVYSGAWTGSETSPTASVDSNGSIDIVSSNNTVYFDVNGTWFNDAVNSALPTSSVQWNSNYDTVNTNSGVWGGSALNISAGEGVKVTLVNNNLVFSTDETVLYDSSANYNLIELSEPASNFERIRLYISTNRPSIFEYPSFSFTNNNWPGGQFGAGWGGKPSMNVFELSANDNAFKVNAGWHTESTASVNWTVLNVSSTWIRPFKVVGINRINNA